MNFIPTKLKGVYRIESQELVDERGAFIKTFNKELFIDQKIFGDWQESYYSISKTNVIRGMHFQIPPKEHAKLVYVTKGIITDVVLDIRQGSPTYGQYIVAELSEKNRQMMYIPAGCAHGFASREDDSSVTYLQTTTHSAEHDRGIRVDSFGMDWGITDPIISKRDQAFPVLQVFTSPFIYS